MIRKAEKKISSPKKGNRGIKKCPHILENLENHVHAEDTLAKKIT